MKPFWESKTIWLNLIPLLISLNEIIINAIHSQSNQTATVVVAVLSGLNIVLRFISKSQVTVK